MAQVYRFLHCADIHLDSTMSTNFDVKKAQMRQVEIWETFLKMVAYAKEHDAYGILISGDLFDTISISEYVVHAFLEAVSKNPQLSFYYLRGNHDLLNRLAIEDHLPKNLYLFDSKWTSYPVSDSIWIHGCELTSSNVSELHESINFDENHVNLVMLHGEVSLTSSRLDKEVIDLTRFAHKGIDYLALGHIHQHQEGWLDERGRYVYPGCLEPRGFDEPGEHGFQWIEVKDDAGILESRFIPFARRQVYTIEADVSECVTDQEMIETIEKELQRNQVSSLDLVQCKLVGNILETTVFHPYIIEHRFMHNYFAFKLVDETTIRIDPLSYKNDPTLKGEFIRCVLQNDELNEQEKMRILQCGFDALSGKDISL